MQLGIINNPPIGSIYHLYTTYSPCLLGGEKCYLPPFMGTRNNHWNQRFFRFRSGVLAAPTFWKRTSTERQWTDKNHWGFNFYSPYLRLVNEMKVQTKKNLGIRHVWETCFLKFPRKQLCPIIFLGFGGNFLNLCLDLGNDAAKPRSPFTAQSLRRDHRWEVSRGGMTKEGWWYDNMLHPPWN